MGVSEKANIYTSEKNKLYYGWYIVAVCFVTLAVLGGIGNTFAVFLVPLSKEFHCSRTALGGVVAAGMVTGGLVTPFWGNLIDRAGGRLIVVTAALFGGLTIIARGQINSLFQLYLIATIGALFFAGSSLITLGTIISHWFRNKRGTAMGMTLIGGSLGGLMMPPLADFLITKVGWRDAYLYLGLLIWIVVIPCAALVLRRHPSDMGLLPDGETPHSKPSVTPGDSVTAEPNKSHFSPIRELTLQQAMHTFAFWMIAIAFFLPMMSGVGLHTHLVAILTDFGLSSRIASICLGLLAAFSVVGRFAFGFAADRFPVHKVYTVCYLCEATGVCMLLAVPLFGTKAFFAYLIVYGLTGGGGLVLAPLLIGKCFGLKSLGTIFGVLAISAVLGGAAGPILAGIVFHGTGSYYPAFIIFSIGEFVAALAISRATVRASSLQPVLT